MKKSIIPPVFVMTFILILFGALLVVSLSIQLPNNPNIPNTYLLNDNTVLYELYGEIEAHVTGNEIRKMLRYATENKISRVVIEINSSGGRLYESIRAANSLIYWSKKYGTIETRVIGYAMSGGFLIFLAGDDRYVAENCYLMWHNPYIPKKAKMYTRQFYPEKVDEMKKMSKFNKKVTDDYINDRINIDIEKELEDGIWSISAKEAQEKGIAKIMKYQGE